MLHLPCLTAVDGFSFPDLTCALARCREDASNWAAFIYNTSCSTCLGRREKKKVIYASKYLSWMHSSHGQTPLFNHSTPQEPATAEKEDRCLKCSSTPPLSSLPFTNTLSRGEGTSAHSGAAAAKTSCFKCRHFKKEHLFVGTLCPRSASHHKWLGVLFISYPPGFLSCEKQTLCRVFLLVFYFLLFQEEGRKWNCPFPPLQISHIPPCFWFCIDWLFFQWNQIWTLLLPSQPPPQCFNQQEGMRAQICQKLVHKFPCSEMHCCTWTHHFPQLMWQTRKESFVFALSDLSSVVKKNHSYKGSRQENNHSQQEGRV